MVVNDNAGFYVRAQVFPGQYSYTTHKGDALNTSGANSFDWGSNCVVNPSDVGTMNADAVCYVEGEELDMYFNGVVLQHNVPSTMCTYFSVEMPYYYQYPTGVGPAQAAYTVNGAGATVDNINTIDGVPYCPYDFSHLPSPNAGPNCCLGSYTMSVTTVGSSPPTVVTPDVSWEDRVRPYLEPAVDLQSKDKNGFPEPIMHYISAVGENAVYTVASPISKQFVSNIYLANYFDASTTNGYNDTTTYPPAYYPSNALIPTTPPPPGGGLPPDITVPTMTAGVYQAPNQTEALPSQPFFQYTCWNRDKEAIARIRVMVRSWDTTGEIGVATSYGPNNNQENPPFNGSPMHDYYIWYDFMNAGQVTNFPYATMGGYLTGFPMQYQ